MASPTIDLDPFRKVEKIICEMNVASKICMQRCLSDSAIWCAELIKDLKCVSGQDVDCPTSNTAATSSQSSSSTTSVANSASLSLIATSGLQSVEDLPSFERTLYDLAYPLFHQQQYRRVQEVLSSCTSPLCRFLRFYAAYFQTDYLRLSTNLQPIGGSGSDLTEDYADSLRQLLLEIEDTIKTCSASASDGFIHFLHAIVAARIGCDKEIVQKSALRAVTLCPGIWAFWQFLSTFISTVEDLDTIDLPKHWFQPLFRAEAFYHLAQYNQSLDLYERMGAFPIGHTNYIQLRMALTLKNLQQTGRALAIMKVLFDADPHRLDIVEVYSDLLYIDQDKNGLAHLSHHLVKFAPRRPETFYVIGNYYSRRGEHERAAEYLWRAAQLQPWRALPLVLLGHEYLELHNTNAAARAYRRAADLDPNDFRSFIALGQLHKILNQRQLSVYYLLRAARLQPSDNRLWMLLAETYEDLEDIDSAIRCYWRAVLVGDSAGQAIFKLGSLYEKKSDQNAASSAYMKFLEICDEFQLTQPDKQYYACVYVARYMLFTRNFTVVKQMLAKAVELNLYNEELRSLEQMAANGEQLSSAALSNPIGPLGSLNKTNENIRICISNASDMTGAENTCNNLNDSTTAGDQSSVEMEDA